MKKYILIFSLLLVDITLSVAQTTYYRYNSAGIPEKAGYSEPTNTGTTFTPYRGADVNLYQRMGQQRQNNYDKNVAVLRERINSIYKDANELYQMEIRRGSIGLKQLNDYVHSLDSSNMDYGDDRIYSSVMQNLDIIEGNIRRMRSGVIDDLRK